MIDVELPVDASASPLTRGFVACLASATEVPVSDVPLPAGGLPQAVGACRTWLAGRGFGLVPVADPGSFQWPGWWIAIVRDSSGGSGTRDHDRLAVLAFGTPPGVVLSPQDPTLLGHAATDLLIDAGWVVASLDPALGLPPADTTELSGVVEGIAIAAAAEADMRLISTAHAGAGRGLDGDRYAARVGTFTPRGGHRAGYDLTLVAAEVLDDLARAGHDVDFPATRRNILTRGIDVNALVGRTFRIGDVLCRGHRLCEPCAHLETLSGPGLLRPLIHRGGLRADILTDGEIHVGASIHRS